MYNDLEQMFSRPEPSHSRPGARGGGGRAGEGRVSPGRPERVQGGVGNLFRA